MKIFLERVQPKRTERSPLLTDLIVWAGGSLTTAIKSSLLGWALSKNIFKG